jgi:hypothetical protein
MGMVTSKPGVSEAQAFRRKKIGLAGGENKKALHEEGLWT